MTPVDVRGFEADHKVLATGSRWRRDGVGASLRTPLRNIGDNVLTPDDVFAGIECRGDILIYDDDHYFMGGALAERFLRAGHRVRLVTPEPIISSWTAMTNEQALIQKRLLELGITAHCLERIDAIDDDVLHTACIYTGKCSQYRFDTLILVTSRASDQRMLTGLEGTVVTLIGDARVPSSIADAVYCGHKFARELGVPHSQRAPKREQAIIFSDSGTMA